MRILLDHGTPRPLRGHLPEHVVRYGGREGLVRLGNGELLAEAERAAYDVLITTDQNMRYQQNLAALRLAIVVPRSNRWPRIRRRVEAIREALEETRAGELREVGI